MIPLTKRLVKSPAARYRLGAMARTLGILAAQVRPIAFDPVATLRKLEEETARLARDFRDAQVIVFPELYLTGEDPFAGDPPEGFLREAAVDVPGPLTERLGVLATRVGRWLVPGSVLERAGDRIHNTVLAFGPDGELRCRYRKLFPWAPFESTDPGDEPAPTFEIDGVGTVGLMICYDGWFPEVARGLALAGAEVIVQPTLTTTPDREQELLLARANAIVNQVFVINVNAATSVGGGRSIGVDPEGRVLFTLGQTEEFALERVDLDRVADVRTHGTRGVARPFHHLGRAPAAVFEPYRRFLRAP
jgi:formamidase